MNDEEYMDLAIKEALKASSKGEVPVGAIIVLDDKIIGRGYNMREIKNSSLAHAEIIAISKACKHMGWRLEDAIMYVTLEPCPMCAGAIIQSRIKKVIYGAPDLKNGCAKSLLNLFNYPFNHHTEVISGVREKECSQLLSNFFKDLRRK